MLSRSLFAVDFVYPPQLVWFNFALPEPMSGAALDLQLVVESSQRSFIFPNRSYSNQTSKIGS
jgi:hypothetical protein